MHLSYLTVYTYSIKVFSSFKNLRITIVPRYNHSFLPS